MQYRPDIDGLRALAVAPVILFHAGVAGFSGGFVGVDVFFVISGFLITGIILDERAAGRFSILRFYERRARRILPALTVVALVSAALAWALLTPRDMLDFGESMLATALFASNILFWREAGYFDVAGELKPLLHTWSLAVEEQFYLFFPPLLMLFWPLGLFRIGLVLAAGAAASLAVAQWGVANKPEAAFFLLPTRGWELLIGALCALRVRAAAPPAGDDRLAPLGIGMILLAVAAYDETTPFPAAPALLPTLGVALILLYCRPGGIAHRMLSHPLAVGVGLVSYSAYLWHQPLFAFVRHHYVVDPPAPVMAGLVLLTFALAWLSWRWIEQPFRRHDVVSPRGVGLFSATACALLIGLGGAIVLRDGGVGRLAGDPAVQERQALLDAQRVARDAYVQAGVCHLNGRGPAREVGPFLEAWSCLPGDEPSLRAAPVAFYGDSISADRAGALRLNGVDVLNLSGGNCTLLPSSEQPSPPYCDALLERLPAAAAAAGVDVVALSVRFDPFELSASYLQKVVDYWSARWERVILFSPPPEFWRLHRGFLTRGAMIDEPWLGAHERFAALMAEVALPPNVIVADSSRLACDERICPTAADGALLLTDNVHLTDKGAKMLGARLLASEIWDAMAGNSHSLGAVNQLVRPAGR